MGRLAVGAAACAMLGGCSSSSGSPENGSGSYIGHASNAVVLIQWTRAGSSVSGSLREAIVKRGGRGVSSDAKSFAGTISGRGLSLQLQGSERETLVGQFGAGSHFSLSLPGTGAGLTTIDFGPGEVGEYNQSVESLGLAEYPSPCALYVQGHEAKVEFSGPQAPAQCEHLVQRLPSAEWTTEEPSSTYERGSVCELTNGSNERAVVTDNGGQAYGHEACNVLSAEGWRNAGAGEGAGGESTATTGGFAVHVEHCGSIEGPGGRLAVNTDDNVGCPEALGVFRDLFAGRGERHEGKDAAETYTDVDGWGCAGGAGGFGCKRSGAFIEASASTFRP